MYSFKINYADKYLLFKEKICILIRGKCRLSNIKPIYLKEKFASDKPMKIGFQNPPKIEKTLKI